LTIHNPLILLNYLRIFFVGLLLIFSVFADANAATTDNNPQVIVSKTTKKIDGHQYQILSSPNVKSTSVKLVGNSKGVKAINAILLKSYLSEIGESDCVDTEKQGGDWGITYNDSVVTWNKSYVVIEGYSTGFCGGGHGFVETGYGIYDLKTGNQEYINLWLKKEYQSEIDVESKLGLLLNKLYIKRQTELLKKTNKKEFIESINGCIEFYGISHFNQFWPVLGGLTFVKSTAYADRECIDEVTLSYKDVLPFLSEKGKHAIQAFRK
jgi:hypothetical protein